MSPLLRRRIRNRIGRGLTFEKVWATIERNAAEAKERSKETKKQAEKRSKEIDRQIKALNKQMGGLHNSFGELAEHLVGPGIVEKFNERGFHIKQAAENGMQILREDRKVRAEIDLYMENGDSVIAIEIKAKPIIQDINEHIERLEILREHRRSLNDNRKVLGGIAGAIFNVKVKKAVSDAGLFVIVQSGDTMKIDTPEGFVPREW
jgi:hypothetical protein